MAATQPVSAQVVGNAFVQQYYHILHNSPQLVFKFYQDISTLGRPEEDGSMSITTTMQAISEKIVSLNYVDLRAELRSVDAQESLNGGVHVLVTGYLTNKDNITRNFAQTFFLAPQDKGYFVLNDVFRYVDPITHNSPIITIPTIDFVSPVTPQQTVNSQVSEEINGGEVFNPHENEEEVPVPEVVNEIQDDSKLVIESNIKIVEMPKKSYASIVMHMKENTPSVRKSVPKIQQKVNQVIDVPVLNTDSTDNGKNNEEEGYSIYIKGLPMNANVTMLNEEFKKYGVIKNGGIQVRSNRQQGFCFGFVEFEVASGVQKALEASPVVINGEACVVEEKRSTITRGNRGRFVQGQGRGGSGFRNEGMRGRGAHTVGSGSGSGRGYNRNGNRGGGYQRVENNNTTERNGNGNGNANKSMSQGGVVISAMA